MTFLSFSMLRVNTFASYRTKSGDNEHSAEGNFERSED